MKRRWMLVLLVALFALGPNACSKGEEAKLPLPTETEQISYAIGMVYAKQIQDVKTKMGEEIKVELDADVIARALTDVLGSKELAMTEEEKKAALTVLNKKLEERSMAERKRIMEERKKMMEERKKMMEANRAAGEKFLAENAKKEGVKVLESGLQYKVLTKGTGSTPTPKDTVKAKYRGTFLDGREFDSGTVDFPVTGVIAGWTEALQLMKVGGKWQLFIPYALAYGPDGDRGIPPATTLLFDIELLEIVGKK